MKKQNLNPGRFGRTKYLLSVVALSVVLPSNAAAHLMVTQRGTLNFVGDGVFMVLSLPVSAFGAIDDDGDGKLSAAEFTKHRPAIVAAVNEKVQLLDEAGPRPLHGMMLSPVASHDAPKAPVDQMVVMGRFALADTKKQLKFYVGLFGKKTGEQEFTISATRAVEPRKDKVVLTLTQPMSDLFSGEK